MGRGWCPGFGREGCPGFVRRVTNFFFKSFDDVDLLTTIWCWFALRFVHELLISLRNICLIFIFIFKVRTQRFPHPAFHPHGIPMHPFLPPIGPHGNPHFAPDVYAFPIPHGPGFDPMFHPPFMEYIHPGMV
jgi:hypothetical protein